jgi:hypothetical protein
MEDIPAAGIKANLAQTVAAPLDSREWRIEDLKVRGTSMVPRRPAKSQPP